MLFMYTLLLAILYLIILTVSALVVYKRIIKIAQIKANGIVQAAKNSVNAIATLPPDALDTYLSNVFMNVILIEIKANISTIDSNSTDELYLRAMVSFMDYLSGVIGAVESRYGEDYLIKWFELKFKVLELNKVISNLIDGNIPNQ